MPTKNPLVSIGMSVYNGEARTRAGTACLEKAIESVLNQTHRNLEFLILDNGSTDKSRAICEAYAKKDPRIRFYPRDEHAPRSMIIYNILLREARGEFFLWAADDDLHLPDRIEKSLRVFDANPRTVLVFSDFCRFDVRTGKRAAYDPALYFPFEQGRYARVKQFLSLRSDDGKGVLVYGIWKRDAIKDDALSERHYYGLVENFVLRNLCKGPFGFVHETLFLKGGIFDPPAGGAAARPAFILRVFHAALDRLRKLFSPFPWEAIGDIVRSPYLPFSEKIGLVGWAFVAMGRLLVARKT
jgi:glycosyltransferase involved in cell wall biosynthesis